MLGRAFTLAAGGQATLAAENLQVRFAGVGGDSRCPPAVQCMWAGKAALAIDLSQNGSAARLTLFSPQDPGTSIAFNGYRVDVVGLSPSSAAQQADYRATLVVTRR